MVNMDNVSKVMGSTIRKVDRDAVRSYLARKRVHDGVSMEGLCANYIEAYWHWALNPHDESALAETKDVEAEYMLRNEIPPDEIVQQFLDLARKKHPSDLADVVDEEFDGARAEAADRFRGARRAKLNSHSISHGGMNARKAA